MYDSVYLCPSSFVCLFMFGASVVGFAFSFSFGAMEKSFGLAQNVAYGGMKAVVLANDNNTVVSGDACSKSAMQGDNVPNDDDAVTKFLSRAMTKAGK